MLPDVDSDTSKSFQECIYLTAGIGCILTASRLRHYTNDPDIALLGGAFIFLLIRFALAPLIKKITTHRGMIHSIPMAILSGELTFFMVTGTVEERLVKAAALTAGYLSHLILDEIYSIDSTGKTLRLKKSFGTALKWTNPKKKSAVTALYTLIFCLGYAACINPEVIERINGNVEIAENALTNESSSWWAEFSDSEKNVSQSWVSQSWRSEIQREAAEFLSQQGLPSPAGQPYSDNAVSNNVMAVLPELELPLAIQFGKDWDRDRLIQPARIVLP